MDEVTQPSVPQSNVTASQTGKKKNYVWIILLILLLIGSAVLVVLFVGRQQKGENGDGISSIPLTQESDLPGTTSVAQVGFSDSFESVIIGADRWVATTYGRVARVEQTGGKLNISIFQEDEREYSAAVVDSAFLYGGDFESSVEIELVTGGPNSEVSFVYHDETEGWPNQLVLFFEKELDGKVFARAVSIRSNEESVLGSDIFEGDAPLKASIVRSGNTVTFTVNGKVIGQAINYSYEEGGRFALTTASSGPAFPAVVSNFDNFSLKLR